jgi:hypothetical protein
MRSLSRIAFGAISDNQVVLKGLEESWGGFHTFSIAPDRPSWTRIPDSAFATPARYIQEIFWRLTEVDTLPGDGVRFVFNPLFATTRTSILNVIAILRATNDLSIPAVIADQDGLPVGYLLPGSFTPDDSRYLSLLSAVDSALDASLLELLCLSKTLVITASRLRLSKHWRNGFEDHGLRPIYKWITQQAISRLLVKPDSFPLHIDPAAARKHRHSIPFTAIMPNHAGDALFFALAFNEVTTHFQGMAVNKAYVDIIQNVAPQLQITAIGTPQVNRDSAFANGKAVSDSEYFHLYKDSLPKEVFYAYCRPSRNYNATEFHLIDHFAFALGHSPLNEGELVTRTRLMPARLSPPLTPHSPAKILLHFDAGWPLKVYPSSLQTPLIELLRSRGHEITVLAPPGYSHPGVKATTFTRLSDFIALANANHVLVGMDSFPSHYCAHVLGLPTLCLFANTKPANSDAMASANYLSLEQALSCRPCYAIAHCPIYGGTECRNFAPPMVVVAQIDSLLAGTTKTHNRIASVGIFPPRNKTNIYLRFIEIQAHVASAVPPSSFLIALSYEFVRAIRREGLFAAIRRSCRFLARKYRALL